MSCLTELLTCHISTATQTQTLTKMQGAAVQIKSHLALLNSHFEQFSQMHLASMLLLAYLLLIAIKPTPAKRKVSYALFVSLAVNYSPLYDALSNVQFYSLYSMIYLITAGNVTNKKIKFTLVIMAIFEFTMAYDRYVNAGVATWLYNSFEEITCLIHGLIISSSFRFKPISIRNILGRLITSMRTLAHHQCLITGL